MKRTLVWWGKYMIYINDKLRISRYDALNLQIEELTKVTSKKTKEERYEWMNIGFYSNLKSAFQGILSRKLFDVADEEISVQNVIEKINEVYENIIDIVGGLNYEFDKE